MNLSDCNDDIERTCAIIKYVGDDMTKYRDFQQHLDLVEKVAKVYHGYTIPKSSVNIYILMPNGRQLYDFNNGCDMYATNVLDALNMILKDATPIYGCGHINYKFKQLAEEVAYGSNDLRRQCELVNKYFLSDRVKYEELMDYPYINDYQLIVK